LTNNEASEKCSEEITAAVIAAEPSRSAAVVARPVRAHRARFLASKRLAFKDSAAIDEILGISRSATATPYPDTSIPTTPLDTTSSTPTHDPSSTEQELELQHLTTSSKSVMDYFKEKLLAKSSSRTPLTTVASTPRDDGEVDYDDRPRGGLGPGSGRAGGIGSSTLRSEETDESGRIGLDMFSRLSTMFTASNLQTAATVEEAMEVGALTPEVQADEERNSRSEKKRKKKKKGSEDLRETDERKKKKSEKPKGCDDEDVPIEAQEAEVKGKKSKKGKERTVETTEASEDVTADVQMEAEPAEAQESKKDKREKKSRRRAEERAILVEKPTAKKKKEDKSSKKRKDADVLIACPC